MCGNKLIHIPSVLKIAYLRACISLGHLLIFYYIKNPYAFVSRAASSGHNIWFLWRPVKTFYCSLMDLFIQWHFHLETVYEKLVVVSSWCKVLSIVVEFYATNLLSMLLEFLSEFLLSNIIQIYFGVSWANKQIVLKKTQSTYSTLALIWFKDLSLFFIVNYVNHAFIVTCCQKLWLFVPRDAAKK